MTSSETLRDKLEPGRTDLVYFFEQILGIRVNHGQRRWFKLLNPQPNGWSWPRKIIWHVAANQIGKTLGLAGIILWACLYKIGVPPPRTNEDWLAWLDRPYFWFHLAPSQGQAYLVLNDMALIIKGIHGAQDKGAEHGLKSLWPEGFAEEVRVEDGVYRGLKMFNGAQVQFRTAEDKAKAVLGKRAHGISFDEAGIEPHLTEILNTVLLMRLISTSGPVIGVGTPDGLNDFYDQVMPVMDEGTLVDTRTWAHDTAALTWSHISDNTGFGVTAEAAAAMEDTLDPSTKEQQLRGAFLEPSNAFFNPSKIVTQAFVKWLPEHTPAKPGRKYAIFWDPSSENDPLVAIVLDITDPVWRGVYMKHYRKPPGFAQMVDDMWTLHGRYNRVRGGIKAPSEAVTGYESIGMAGSIIRQSLRGLSPLRPLDLSGSTAPKRNALGAVRAALSQQMIVFPNTGDWLQLRKELLGYKLKDDKIKQDSVMALAGAVNLASSNLGQRVAAFDPGARVAAWR